MSVKQILTKTTLEDMEKSRQRVGHFLSAPQNIPVAFTYGGKKISGIPLDWHPITQRRRIDANMVETVFMGQEPKTGLEMRVECLEYADYPVVEWTAWLTQKGSQPTPLIADLLGLDAGFLGQKPVLWHCNGDYCHEDGYAPKETPVGDKDSLKFAPVGGRPCDQAFPYFRILFQGSGLTLAIGWPGQWSASFQGTKDGVWVKAGQEQISLKLMPGETIRTPRITLLSWTGSQERSVNLWRRWYLAHVLPRPDGQPLQPLLAATGTDPGEGGEYTGATEENQLRYQDLVHKIGLDFDIWWIDAGWYPCKSPQGKREWPVTGSWEPDPERFPRGLKPISDHAAQYGAKLLLWFEPERVRFNTRLETEHPEFLLRSNRKDWAGSENSLLNLGNPACRAWLTDHICRLIKENGIKVYRQDFNFEPLSYWQENEPADRQGINENLHVQGYLQFWDDLLARNPGLWIDSCASGGRRNDLETMRRSVPLHYSDYAYGISRVKTAFHHTLFAWIPYFKDVALNWNLEKFSWGPGEVLVTEPLDSFAYHCGMAGMFFPSFDANKTDNDYALMLKMVKIWRRAVKLMLYADYYPLTPFSKSGEKWVVWQFDCPEKGMGLIQGIRLKNCPEGKITVKPRGISPETEYVLENQETGQVLKVPGKTLVQDGFTFELPQRSGAIWFYRVTYTGK